MRLKTALANIVTITAIALSTLSCANIGTPEGGPRDYAPPVMVNCNPQPGTVNFKGDKVEVESEGLEVYLGMDVTLDGT